MWWRASPFLDYGIVVVEGRSVGELDGVQRHKNSDFTAQSYSIAHINLIMKRQLRTLQVYIIFIDSITYLR